MPTLKVKGMSCRHCVMAVTKALEALPGLKNIQVDLKSGQVAYEETQPVEQTLIKAKIREAGYEVE